MLCEGSACLYGVFYVAISKEEVEAFFSVDISFGGASFILLGYQVKQAMFVHEVAEVAVAGVRVEVVHCQGMLSQVVPLIEEFSHVLEELCTQVWVLVALESKMIHFPGAQRVWGGSGAFLLAHPVHDKEWDHNVIFFRSVARSRNVPTGPVAQSVWKNCTVGLFGHLAPADST